MPRVYYNPRSLPDRGPIITRMIRHHRAVRRGQEPHPDSSHPDRQVDDQIRPGVVQQGQRRLALHQVVVLAAGDGDVGRAPLPRLLHHEGAEEARGGR